MKKTVVLILIVSLLILSSCVDDSLQNSISFSKQTTYDITMKRDILCLMLAYPGHIVDVVKENKKVYIVMKSGKKILYDDKIKKSNEGKINNPDLEDMLSVIYPINDIKKLMDKNNDPGRIRVYPFLKEIYGSNRKEIESNLTNIRFGNSNYAFNKNNMASSSLKSVVKELNKAINNNSKIYSNVYPGSGTYNYRVISGTGRLSPHSFGIAIDLKRDNNDYWKWANRTQGQKRLDSYPREIVRIFENHNFIWGGKWGHFDILHFEYRPEFLIKGRYFSKDPDVDKKWYDGIPLKDENIKEYIDLIDKSL